MNNETKIRYVSAREILDSRGQPTVEVDVSTDLGRVRASVPSGESKGVHEAKELRDKGSRFLGQGVQKAIANVNEIIAPKIVGEDCTKQRQLDEIMLELDGTADKSKLGANGILACSMAISRAGAFCSRQSLFEYLASISGTKKVVLPVPWLNLIEGGVHAGNYLDFQEYHLIPNKAENFSEALRMGAEIYQYLRILLRQKYGKLSLNVGYEGGFSPNLKLLEEPFQLIMEASEEAGYKDKINLGVDVAASQFFKEGKYIVEGKSLRSEELLEVYIRLKERYPIILIEDGYDQDAWEDWQKMMRCLGSSTQIVGDDLTVTNADRISEAVQKKACNSVIIKINQIGTISEVIEVVKYCREVGLRMCVGNRGGETEDSYIADLAVGLGVEQCKFGAPTRGERTAKYNRLLRLEEKLADEAKFAKLK